MEGGRWSTHHVEEGGGVAHVDEGCGNVDEGCGNVDEEQGKHTKWLMCTWRGGGSTYLQDDQDKKIDIGHSQELLKEV